MDKMQAVQCCVCNCKDTNLKAIHNAKIFDVTDEFVVFATAKILIWKQFTTGSSIRRRSTPVVFATAKILIWKQFTTVDAEVKAIECCVCNCKDTNLKAIHNSWQTSSRYILVVFATAKILIWKQFTTNIYVPVEDTWLCLQLQRY